MDYKCNDNEKLNTIRRASQLKLAKDRILSHRIIFLMKKPKPKIIKINSLV